MADIVLSSEESAEIAESDPVFGDVLVSSMKKAKRFVRETIASTPSVKDTAVVGASLAEVLQEGDQYVAKIPSNVVEGLASGELEKMKRGATNLWNGAIRKAGGNKAIEAQANFEKVELSGERLQGLRSLALQAQIKEISEQLEELGEKIDGVLEGQHSDRVAEVEAGMEMYELANKYSDQDQRDRQISNAQQSLTEGRKKLERWIRKTLDKGTREIQGPGEKALALGGIHKPRIERLNELEHKEKKLQEALKFYVLASGYIFKIHAAQGEFDVADTFIEQHLQALSEFAEKLQDDTIPLPPKVAERGPELNELHNTLRETRSAEIRLEFTASDLLSN